MPDEEAETGNEGDAETLDEKRGADMIFATRQGDVATVKALLAEGVPAGFIEASGWTALRWAAAEGKEDVLALLLEHGAMEDELSGGPSTEEGNGGGTSLHWAAFRGHVGCVWRLLTCKPAPDAKALDPEYNTPLHLAAASGYLLVIQTLLSYGVEVSLTNAYGNSAYMVSTSPECKALLKEAASAALQGRPYLCSCSGEFCSEADSSADEVIDKVSRSIPRPVRYTTHWANQIRAAEDDLTAAMKAGDVPSLDLAIKAADKIGASLPLIKDAITGIERLRAQIALNEVLTELQAARPLTDRAPLRPLAAPLKQAREKGVADGIISDAEMLAKTVEAEVSLAEVLVTCEPYKMRSEEEIEEPPSAESDFAKRAENMIAKLAGAIHHANEVDAMSEVIEKAEIELAHLTAESELRKALLPPKEGVAEDGTPCQTQHNGSKTYSALEDLQFRNDFLDASLEKCITSESAPGIIAWGQKIQKDLKAALKQAQIEDEERKAKEAAAAAKAAKKGKKKK